MATSCNGDLYVETIERTECIGNSLAKINSNFAALDIAICTVEGTTSKLNNLQGILKGNGNGDFLVADPDYDYYVPGRPLFTDFITYGKIQCAKDLTIGDGSLIVTKGNVGCIGLFATGAGSFTGALDTRSSLKVGGKGTFEGELVSNSLTVNTAAAINGSLDVAQQITAGSNIQAGSVSTPIINATTSITVPTINVTSALNAGSPGVISTLNRANVTTAFVSTLTALDGVFTGTRLTIGQGTITNLSTTTGNITTLTTTTGNITNIASASLTTNSIYIGDANLFTPGILYTNVAKISTADIKNLQVAQLNVNITNTTTLNATGDVNGNNLNATTRFFGPLANIATINATAVNTTSLGAVSNITVTGTANQNALTLTNGNLLISNGSITTSGNVRGGSLTVDNGVISGSDIIAVRTTTTTLTSNGEVVVSTGNIRVATGNVNVTNGNIAAGGSATIGNGATISSGNLNVTTGNATIGGTVTITGVANQNGINLTNGNLNVAGNATIGGTASQNGFVLTNGNINISNGNITASGGLTLTNGGITANSGSLSIKSVTAIGATGTDGVISAGQKITAPLIDAGNSGTINTGTLVVNAAGNVLTPSLNLTSNLASIAMNGTFAKLNIDGGQSTVNIGGTLTSKDILATGTLKCNGDITAFATSDKRLKKNITVIDNSLDKISKLSGVNFDWDTELQSVHEGADTGVIAQEVEEVMPTAVTTRENGYKAVKYDRLIPLLIEAVKELKEQNVALREEIEALKTK